MAKNYPGWRIRKRYAAGRAAYPKGTFHFCFLTAACPENMEGTSEQICLFPA